MNFQALPVHHKGKCSSSQRVCLSQGQRCQLLAGNLTEVDRSVKRDLGRQLRVLYIIQKHYSIDNLFIKIIELYMQNG